MTSRLLPACVTDGGHGVDRNVGVRCSLSGAMGGGGLLKLHFTDNSLKTGGDIAGGSCGLRKTELWYNGS